MIYKVTVESTYYFQVPPHIKQEDVEYFDTENQNILRIVLKSGEEVEITKCKKFIGSLTQPTEEEFYENSEDEECFWGK